MPAATELIAHDRDVEAVRQAIGADWLIYQDLEDLIKCGVEGNALITEFEDSVFSGKYVTGDVQQEYLQHLGQARSDSAKSAAESPTA